MPDDYGCSGAHLASTGANKLALREQGMQLDLVHGWRDACFGQQVVDLRHIEVGDADGAHQAVIDQALHRLPATYTEADTGMQ